MSNWMKFSLIVGALAFGLIAIFALGRGIEFFEYWYLVAFGFGVLALLLIWEALATYFGKGNG